MSKLSQLNTIHRPDMLNHPVMRGQRPGPIGIAASGVYQYEGTNLFQWWTTGPSPYWRPYGKPVLIDSHSAHGTSHQEGVNLATQGREG